ncbi:MAG TPA: family 43 glycosylhydrolase, partial [Flavisolibacter sp.]|nr:family 43 glycosylhydrolase [Flavisolibacter sp.]
MYRKINKTILLAVAFTANYFFAEAQTIHKEKTSLKNVWVSDNGDGTYSNPVIHADYSDPDAIRVGDDYYMVSSSFEDIPGLPILHSKDLV